MAAFSFVLFAAATARFLQNPVASSGGLDMDPNDPDRMVDSFGRSTLEPCSKIDCGETACPDPFVLKTDSTCCGVCYAPDHVVAIDPNAGPNAACVRCADGSVVRAACVIVTVPLAALQRSEISFVPPLPPALPRLLGANACW